MDETPLFERLGGRAGVTAVVEKAIANHYANAAVRVRFDHVAERRDVLTAHAVEFFCTGLSGVETYTGRTMADAHAGMNIDDREFVAVLDDIMAALTDCAIDERERVEVLGILYGMKGDIVHL